MGGVGVPVADSLMVSVFAEGLPRAAFPIGVPSVKVSARPGPGSWISRAGDVLGRLPDPE